MTKNSVSLTISCEGAGKNAPKKDVLLKEGGVIRIGRSPVADFQIEHRGVSQNHAELRLQTNGSSPRVLIRDLSSNGTGIRRAGSKDAVGLKKDTDEPLPDGATLLVPMRLKENHGGRAWVTIIAQDPRVSRSPQPVRSPVVASGSEREDDGEANRKRFVELLLKTRNITGSTTYVEAEELLSSESAWNACDSATRMECFQIFVDHLGDNSTKKKDKKKSKEKDKSSKKKDGDKAKDKDKERKRDKTKTARTRPLSGSPEVRGRNGRKSRGGRRSESRAAGSPCASPSRSTSRRAKRVRRCRARSNSG